MSGRRGDGAGVEEFGGLVGGEGGGFLRGHGVGARVFGFDGDLDGEFEVEGWVHDRGLGGEEGEVEVKGVDAGDEAGVEGREKDFVVAGEGDGDDDAGGVVGEFGVVAF